MNKVFPFCYLYSQTFSIAVSTAVTEKPSSAHYTNLEGKKTDYGGKRKADQEGEKG